jgi:hypothetical protein
MPVANPGKVQARQIQRVEALDAATGSQVLELYGGVRIVVTSAMRTARTPATGDYVVVPSEGPPYLVAKSTFQVTY